MLRGRSTPRLLALERASPCERTQQLANPLNTGNGASWILNVSQETGSTELQVPQERSFPHRLTIMEKGRGRTGERAGGRRIEKKIRTNLRGGRDERCHDGAHHVPQQRKGQEVPEVVRYSDELPLVGDRKLIPVQVKEGARLWPVLAIIPRLCRRREHNRNAIVIVRCILVILYVERLVADVGTCNNGKKIMASDGSSKRRGREISK